MLFERIADSYRKVIWFAGFGALGCTLAAIVGEAWLALTRTSPPLEPVSICLLLDTSGSMSGGELEEMKQVARDFVGRQDLSLNYLSVVGFDNWARRFSSLSQDSGVLLNAIDGLEIGVSTNMSDGLREARATLTDAPGDRYILLFTDGVPNSPHDTLRESERCREQGTQVLAVATGTADVFYLAQVTSDPLLVFPAQVGQFEQAFQNAEQAILSRQLVESDPSGAGTAFGVMRIGAWTLLLAVGVGLSLVAAQNLYFRRAALSRTDAIRGTLGSAAAGFIAGAAGQWLFSSTTDAPTALVVLGRIAGWALVGLLLGLGVSRFVPNLRPTRGLVGGVVGGGVGAIGFLLLGLLLGDVVGRLIGAAIIGFCIGAMIALMDVAFREAWLEVEYGPGEERTVSLGRRPVTVGGDASEATVYVSGVLPVALRYILEGGKIYCQDVASGQQYVISPGDTRAVGKATVRLQVAAPVQKKRSAGGSSPVSPEPQQKTTPSPSPSPGPPAPTAGTPPRSTTLYLRIRSKQFEMKLGAKLRAVEIPGLETNSSDQVVAEVVANPNDPSVLGLKNHSNRAWEAVNSEGKSSQVDPGRSARLAEGTKLRFGLTEGVVSLLQSAN